MSETKLPVLVFNIYRDGQLLRTEKFQQEVIKIGRTATSHIVIDDDDLVSKMHVVIDIKSSDEIELIDLGSVQGTYVNGKKVNKCYLRSGDEIQVGNTKLIVQIEEEEEEGVTEVVKEKRMQPQQVGVSSQLQSTPPQHAAVATSPSPVASMGYGMYEMGYGAQMYQTQPAYDPIYSLIMEEKVDTGGMVNINEIEGAEEVIEIVSIWKNTILDVKHLKSGTPGKNKEEHYSIYRVGEDPKCDFYVPSEVIGGNERFVLARMAGGIPEIYIMEGMQVKEVTDDGSRVDLDASYIENVGGNIKRIRYEKGKRILIEAGDVKWFIHTVREGKLPPAPLDIDWNNTIYGGIATVVHIILLVLINFIPPDPQSLSLDVLAEENRFVRYILEPPEIQQEEVPEWFNKDKKDEESGGKGKRHKGEEGQMGDPNAPKTGKR